MKLISLNQDNQKLYINMPEFGLGKALGTEKVTRETETAKLRLRRERSV